MAPSPNARRAACLLNCPAWRRCSHQSDPLDLKHPEGIPFWLGDSRGRWEGETLVVDSNDFTDQTWFDRAGNFHSDSLHVVERYSRTSLDHIKHEVTIEDPKVFTRPWKMSMPLYRRQEPNVQLLEYACYEDLTLEKFFPGKR